jgi:hypothetical protein
MIGADFKILLSSDVCVVVAFKCYSSLNIRNLQLSSFPTHNVPLH